MLAHVELGQMNAERSSWAFLLKPLAALALLHSGAIFGFFYAWICSTMWGLDAADPNVAISAMQAMNASVRNLVFVPARASKCPSTIDGHEGDGRMAGRHRMRRRWSQEEKRRTLTNRITPWCCIEVPMPTGRCCQN